MAKSTRKKPKRPVSAKKSKKTAKKQTKASEYVGCLLELHKWQGVLLTHLHKEM